MIFRRESLKHNGRVRASSHLVEDMVLIFLKEIMEQHLPDALINLGDLIRSEKEISTYKNIAV